MNWSGRFENFNMVSFRKDLISGVIVGIIAIPLGMAFAISSGVKPEYGIYSTIIAGIIISIFGGSRFQIGGPTGAFIPILFSIVMQYGYENLLIAGFLAGVFLLLMGLLKLGTLIQFIPRPVIIGFTTGIAIVIFSGQIVNFFGLEHVENHKHFLANMKEIGVHLHTMNFYSVLTSCICLFTLLLTQKVFPKIPGAIIGIVISSMIAFFLYKGEVPTIQSAFGAIPSKLPVFHVPDLTLEKMEALIGPAFVIAMLGGIESLLSAVVADKMTDSKHNSHRELIGQGLANMVTPLFGGIPATGAIARTATNIKNGAVSPFSGIIHGFVVLIVLLLFAPYASQIPLASMAPVLMVVAWNMSERKEFVSILRTKTSDTIILVSTFLLTVFFDLTTAVEIGLILTVLIFVLRMSKLFKITKVLPDPSIKHQKLMSYMVREGHDCPQISIYTIEGPVFFGSVNVFKEKILSTIGDQTEIIILRMGKVPFMDTSGEAILESIVKSIKKQGGLVLLTGIQSQPIKTIKSTGLFETIGKQNFFEHSGEALVYALTKIKYNKCIGCKHFAFQECEALSQHESLCENTSDVERKSKFSKNEFNFFV